MSKDIEIPSCKCERCGYSWYLRYPQKPRVCPKCKSPYWQINSDFTRDLDIDSQRAKRIIKELTYKVDEAARKQTVWETIIREGWQRMLVTSELPIKNIDRVFAGGFSVYDWFMNGSRISSGLAESIVEHFFTSAGSPNIAKDDVIERAKDVLEWKPILDMLDQDMVKVLGLVWFADKLSAEIMYPETEVLVQENAWQLLEKNMGKKREELVNHVESIIERIDEKRRVTSWAEIIRFA